MKRLLFLSLLVITLLSATSQTYGQTDPGWMQKTKWENLELAPKQRQRAQRWQQHPYTRQVQPITLGSIRQLQRRGALTFSLPGEPRRYVARQTKVEYWSEDHFEWRGTLDQGHDNGEVLVLAQDGQLFGTLSVNGRHFRITDLGQRQNILLEYDTDQLPPFQCAGGPAQAPPNVEEIKKLAAARTEDASSIVTILFVYTPAAEAYTDVAQRASIDISNFNAILENSHIGKDVLRFAFVGLERWEHSENVLPEFDVAELENNSFISELRETLAADLVLAYTGNDLLDPKDIGYTGASSLNFISSEEAHAVVRVMRPSSKYYSAHFLFHLFGCDHMDDGPGPTYAHAFEFFTYILFFKKWWQTVVESGDRDVILHLSNPYVYYKGSASGESRRHNNAQQVRDVAPLLCEYRSHPPQFAVSITGPTQATSNSSLTWQASPSNCGSTPTYRWDTSTDGFTYQYAGTGSSYTQTVPANQDLYLRLSGTCAGQNATTFLVVDNTDANCVICDAQRSPQAGGSENAELRLFPNPIAHTESVTLDLSALQAGPKKVIVLSSSGRTVFTIETEASRLSIPMNFQAGHYLVKVTSQNQVITSPLIVE